MLQVDIARRLRLAGAKVGDVRVALSWNSVDDLDLHVTAPSGEEIYYGHRNSGCRGELDIDMNRDRNNLSSEPVESIYWPTGCAPTGVYKVNVKLYSYHSGMSWARPAIPFQVRIENGGVVSTHSASVSGLGNKVHVTEFMHGRPLLIDFGRIFKGMFEMKAEIRGAENQMRLQKFVETITSSLGATALRGVTPEQMHELSRLKKMFERMNDPNNYEGERRNAHRLLQASLGKLSWSEDGFRAACGSDNPGADAGKPTLVTVAFSKKVTARRAWFEELAHNVAEPMGAVVALNKANGHFGRVGHNGVSLCGTPVAAVIAGAVIAKIAEAAMMACNKSDKDTFCANFCRQVYPQDTSDPDARRRHGMTAKTWLRQVFTGDEVMQWNTPTKKARNDTPTAELGRLSGQKRKANFTGDCDMVTKHHVKALTWH